jgi:succinate dehydrogenase / fumarate reductase membrane anchor subunit
MGRQTTLERKGTTLGQVRGLGSAHEGSHHWLLQRVTAAGNLLTVLYLVFSVLLLSDLSYDSVFRWLSQPAGALPMALLIVSVFWHARLGLQVMIEDYVHGPGTKFAAILVLNLATFAAAAFGLLCVVRIVAMSIGLDAMQGIMQAMQAMQQGGTPGGGM